MLSLRFSLVFNIQHSETEMVTDVMLIDTNCEIFDDYKGKCESAGEILAVSIIYIARQKNIEQYPRSE